MGNKIKNDIKCGKCKQKLNADKRPFDENYYTKMCLLRLRLIGVVDVKLA